MLLLAPLTPDDEPEVVRTKLRLVARFVDILLTWRLWNFRSIAYNTLQYTSSASCATSGHWTCRRWASACTRR
ncbi:MAG TPA: hypothetical protein VF054_08245 [Micromonosporaceae bacterium]